MSSGTARAAMPSGASSATADGVGRVVDEPAVEQAVPGPPVATAVRRAP